MKEYYCFELKNEKLVDNQIAEPFISTQLDGLKKDIRILKIVVQENLKHLNTYFDEVEFQFELFFSDHFLSLYSDLFNNEILFRLWDQIILYNFKDHSKNGQFLIVVAY